MVAPLSTATPLTVKEPVPVTAWLNVTCVPANVVSAGNTTGLLYTCVPLLVTEFMVNAVLRKIRLAALVTLMRPTMLLPALSKITLALATVKPVVPAADTVVPAVCVTLPLVVLMVKAPVLSRLPSTMGALPLICIVSPAVSVAWSPMVKANEATCDVAPVTVNCVAAIKLDVCVIHTPFAPALAPRPLPFKLTLLAVELTVEPFK